MKKFKQWKFNRELKKYKETCVWTKDGKCHPFSLCIIEECIKIWKLKQKYLN